MGFSGPAWTYAAERRQRMEDELLRLLGPLLEREKRRDRRAMAVGIPAFLLFPLGVPLAVLALLPIWMDMPWGLAVMIALLWAFPLSARLFGLISSHVLDPVEERKADIETFRKTFDEHYPEGSEERRPALLILAALKRFAGSQQIAAIVRSAGPAARKPLIVAEPFTAADAQEPAVPPELVRRVYKVLGEEEPEWADYCLEAEARTAKAEEEPAGSRHGGCAFSLLVFVGVPLVQWIRWKEFNALSIVSGAISTAVTFVIWEVLQAKLAQHKRTRKQKKTFDEEFPRGTTERRQAVRAVLEDDTLRQSADAMKVMGATLGWRRLAILGNAELDLPDLPLETISRMQVVAEQWQAHARSLLNAWRFMPDSAIKWTAPVTRRPAPPLAPPEKVLFSAFMQLAVETAEKPDLVVMTTHRLILQKGDKKRCCLRWVDVSSMRCSRRHLHFALGESQHRIWVGHAMNRWTALCRQLIYCRKGATCGQTPVIQELPVEEFNALHCPRAVPLEKQDATPVPTADPTFLAALDPLQRARVSALDGLLYRFAIEERTMQKSIEWVGFEEAADLLRRLSVEELQMLEESARLLQEQEPDSFVPTSNFRRAAEFNPFNDVALLCHGVILAEAGQTAAGLAWVETAVERNPENEAARRMLGEIEDRLRWGGWRNNSTGRRPEGRAP